MHLLEQRRWQLLLDVADETEDGLPCKKATSSQISPCNAQETSGSFLEWLVESLELHIIPPNLFPSNLPFCTPVSQTHNPSAEDPHKLQTYGIPCVSDFPSPWIPWTGKGAPALRPFICCVIPEILLSSMSGIPDGYLDFYYDTLDPGKLCPKSVTSVVSKWITWYTSIYIFFMYNEIILFKRKLWRFFEHFENWSKRKKFSEYLTWQWGVACLF